MLLQVLWKLVEKRDTKHTPGGEKSSSATLIISNKKGCAGEAFSKPPWEADLGRNGLSLEQKDLNQYK